MSTMMNTYLSTAFLLLAALVNGLKDEDTLREMLSREHNLKSRPVKKFADPVKITMNLKPISLVDLNEAEQSLSLYAWVEMKWDLYNVTWKPADHGNVTFLEYEASEIWTPVMSIINSVESPISVLETSERYGRLFNFGRFFISRPGLINVICLLDITYFPFDEQVCHIEFDSWTLPLEHLEIMGNVSKIDLRTYRPNCQWELKETWIHEEISHGARASFKTVSFVMRLRRKPLYLVLNLVLPFLGLMLLQLVMFYVPPDEGEKISVGITLLLSKTVFLLMMQGNMPETSDQTPILTLFIFLDMVLTGLEIICSIVVISYEYRVSPDEKTSKLMAFTRVRILKVNPESKEEEILKLDPKATAAKLDKFFFKIFASITTTLAVVMLLLFLCGPVVKSNPKPLAGYGYYFES